MPDKAYRDLGLDPKEVLRHERGHCNGWGEDHAGGRPSSSLLDIDGNRFDEYCNSTERESKLICASYTLGVSDTLAVQRTLRPSNARACIPEEVQLDQLVAVALIYVKSFPAERHLRAAQLLMVAFADAWPCKRK